MLGKPNSTGGVTPCDNEPFCQNYTTSLDDSIQQAMRAGVNVDDNGPTFISNLIAALQNGMASMQLVDDSARRVLMAGASLGLMDPPDGFYDTIQETDTALARQLALEAAEQGESGPSYLAICPR
jgi:beta-glucosidase-like glycosyl hydrolase